MLLSCGIIANVWVNIIKLVSLTTVPYFLLLFQAELWNAMNLFISHFGDWQTEAVAVAVILFFK